MSDYEKNKFYKRPKYYPSQREGSHPAHYGVRPYKPPGFVKYDREYKDTERSESKEKIIPQPTILLKAREPREPNTERSTSPKRQTRDNDSSTSTLTSHENFSASCSMTQSTKLIADGTIMNESIQDFLQDSPDFLVVGILGPQGVGKSTIMNLLAQQNLTDQIASEIFNNGSTNTETEIKILTENVSNIKVDDSKSDKITYSNIIFKPQNLEHIEMANYGTNGIDAYITSNRVILLDCQPIISMSVLDEIVQNDFKRCITTEFLTVENSAEIQSLQLATFIMSVCHVVILMQDWFFDSNFIRFLQTAEMFKPSIPTVEEDFMEYFPHIMLVHNRATMEDFTPVKFKNMQQLYKEVFNKSKLHLESAMGIGNGKIMHSLSPNACGDPLNLFLLPEYDDEKGMVYYGHPSFIDLVRELRAQIHSVTRIPLLSTQLTERNWLQFATRVWETVKKSSFFVEYCKLMP